MNHHRGVKFNEDYTATDNVTGFTGQRIDPLLGVGNEASVQDRLQDAGVSDEALPDVMIVVESEAKRRAWHLTCEAFAVIGRRLSRYSTHCASLAHALGIADGSLEMLAAHFGTSKQSLGNSAALLKKAFAGASTLPKPPAPLVRPESPNGEEWLTVAESMQFTGMSLSRLLILAGEHRATVGRRKFFNKATLLEAVESYLVNRAKPENANSSKILNRPDILNANVH